MIRRKNKKFTFRLVPFTLVLFAGLLVIMVIVVVAKPSQSLPPVANNIKQQTPERVESAPNEISNYGVPARLVIPKISVDAIIKHVGLTESGDMESPKTNEDTGWYKYGSRPGNEGSAVIAGHLGLNGDAVFGQLDQLVKGDTLSVTDDKGRTANFKVRERRIYKYDETPSEVFISTSGSYLNLITCDGDWKPGQETFSQRLVIFTDKVD